MNWPEERNLSVPRHSTDNSLNSRARNVSTSVEMNTLLPVRRTTTPDGEMRGPVNLHGTNSTIPSTTSQAIYRDAGWLGPCMVILWVAVIAFTLVCVFSVYQLGFGVSFPPQWTLVELWFGELALFTLALSAYPAANISVVFLGIYLENWRSSTNRQSWTVAKKFLFLCIASSLSMLHFILWFLQLLSQSGSPLSRYLLWVRLLGSWLVLALLYILLVLLKIGYPNSITI